MHGRTVERLRGGRGICIGLLLLAGGATTAGAGGHVAETGVVPFLLPAGHEVVVQEADGRPVVLVRPRAAPSLGGSTPGTLECNNDVRGWGFSHAPLAPNLFAPLHEHAASRGECRNVDGDWHRGPVTSLRFYVSGDGGGGLVVSGYDTGGNWGEYAIRCVPAGSGGAAGYDDLFVHYGEVENAECTFTHAGDAKPSRFARWTGRVENSHSWAGTAYGAAN